MTETTHKDLKPGDKVVVPATVAFGPYPGFEAQGGRFFQLPSVELLNQPENGAPRGSFPAFYYRRVTLSEVKPDPTPILEGLLRYCAVNEGQTLADINHGEEFIAKAKAWLEER